MALLPFEYTDKPVIPLEGSGYERQRTFQEGTRLNLGTRSLNEANYRAKLNKTYYRLFAFWDKTEKLDTVVPTHRLIKKTDKIPKSEIERAEKTKKYINHKTKRK